MNKQLSNLLSIIILLTFLVTGCNLSDGDDNGTPSDNYLISFEMEREYMTPFMKAIMGQVTNAYPDLEFILDHMEHDISVYSIEYRTQFQGEEVIASGLVCIPDSSEAYPVLSYQNGTNTLHAKAPSADPDNELFLLLEFVSSTGFIVTIPDYLGFGSSNDMFHPYLDKESTVSTVIDMLKATRELVNNHLNVSMSDDVYLTGYSQGGWATMQVQKELEEDFSSDFDLKASVCGAGPYDLNYINDYIMDLTDYPMPYYLGYIYNSYTNLGYITTPLSEVFLSPYDEKIPILYDGTRSGQTINDELTIRIPLLFTNDYIENHDTDEKYESIRTSLASNSISAWKTTTPTMLVHGTADEFIPPMVTSMIFQDFLSKGVGVNNITMIPLQGHDHQSAIVPAGIAAISWFMDLKEED